MPLVKINTSDTEWIARRGVDEPVAHGTDIKGVMYFNTTAEVASVEHVRFAGAQMIRFDLGADAPADHNRHAMYPAHYLVAEDGAGMLSCAACPGGVAEHDSICHPPYPARHLVSEG